MDIKMFIEFPGILITVGVLFLIASIILGIIAYKKSDVIVEEEKVPEAKPSEFFNSIENLNNGDTTVEVVNETPVEEEPSTGFEVFTPEETVMEEIPTPITHEYSFDAISTETKDFKPVEEEEIELL